MATTKDTKPVKLTATQAREKVVELQSKIDRYDKTAFCLMCKKHKDRDTKFYLNTEDNGEEFFKEVLEGNYSGYDYSKGLIGLYKNIITALLCAAYARKKDIESIQLIKEDCLTFKKTIIGNRFINELKLNEFLKEELLL